MRKICSFFLRQIREETFHPVSVGEISTSFADIYQKTTPPRHWILVIRVGTIMSRLLNLRVYEQSRLILSLSGDPCHRHRSLGHVKSVSITHRKFDTLQLLLPHAIFEDHIRMDRLGLKWKRYVYFLSLNSIRNISHILVKRSVMLQKSNIPINRNILPNIVEY